MIKLIYGIACVLIALFCLCMAVKCRKKKDSMSGITAALCFSGGLVVLFYSMTLFFSDSFRASVAISVVLVCIDVFVYFLLRFTLRLTGRKSLRKWYKIVLWSFITIDCAFLLTNPWTGVVLEYREAQFWGEMFYVIFPNTWYYAHCAYAYFVAVAVIAILALQFSRIPLVYAGRYMIELFAVVCVVLVNIFYLTGKLPIDLSCLLYGWSARMLYQSALNYQPGYLRKKARYLMANKLRDPILLFDVNDYLADFNSEAEEKFDLSPKDLCHMTREYFETQILHVSYEQNPNTDLNREVVVQMEYADIFYSFTLQILHSNRGLYLGKMYVFRDITKQKLMYKALENNSVYDRLTGFYSSRIFGNKLEELNKTSEEYVVAVCNIASLKLINSYYGRKTGNTVIQKMAEILRDSLPEDTLFCYAEDDCTVIVTKGISEEQLELSLANVARKIKKKTLENVPVFLDFGIARRENTAVPLEEYLKYASMNLVLKRGKIGVMEKQETTMALLNEYFNNNYETLEHVSRVKELALELAKRRGLNDTNKLELLCLYHDIGRVKTEDEVWSRAGIITTDERDIMKLHSVSGYQIIKKMQLDCDIADLVLYHHENYDGSGYPYGLAREEIPLEDRIFAIADAYDVMVHNGLYKGTVTEEEALEEIKNCSGKQFDPVLVNLFEVYMKEK